MHARVDAMTAILRTWKQYVHRFRSPPTKRVRTDLISSKQLNLNHKKHHLLSFKWRDHRFDVVVVVGGSINSFESRCASIVCHLIYPNTRTFKDPIVLLLHSEFTVKCNCQPVQFETQYHQRCWYWSNKNIFHSIFFMQPIAIELFNQISSQFDLCLENTLVLDGIFCVRRNFFSISGISFSM